MAYQVKTKGIILHEMPVGDYDKRLIILTKEQGKITAFVKGARRQNSKMLAVTQVFAYCDFVLSKGRNSYNIYQGELIEPFHNLRLDITDMTYGMFMLEFANYVAEEEMENQPLMKLLLYGLNTIDKEKMDTRLTAQTYLLKAMSLLGFTPWVNDCVLCHETEGIRYFSPQAGGFLCSKKHSDGGDKIKISQGTVHSVRYILSKPIETVFKFTLEQEGLLELEYVVKRFMDYHLNYRFKTLEFLKTI